MKKLSCLFFLLIGIGTYAQSVVQADSIQKVPVKNLKFNKKQLIIPSVFFAYGIVALDSDYLKDLNFEIRDELKESIDEKFTIDDISQYTPALSVYVLNNIGIKGKNNLKDRSIILATSYIIMSGTTLGLKSWAKVERPDGSANNSFPSGHTATAFSGAEFLWQEYKDVNIWYGISGYVVATGTGFFRIYNARHWLSDVVMGAGIGILSTKVAYWIFPFVQNRIFKSNKNTTAAIAPFYNGKQMGLGLIMNLK
ncbi:MAG: phosphatase PAP2 family protein [Flavobacterium sp.]|nr:phosphatase PAP2 family protein [Flavobacterium sp.]